MSSTTFIEDNAPATLNDVLSGLEVRVASRGDRESLDELAERTGRPVPSGSVMVGVVGDRLIAAAPLDGGDALCEATAAGAAAAAVVSYAATQIRRAHHRPRVTGSPS